MTFNIVSMILAFIAGYALRMTHKDKKPIIVIKNPENFNKNR